MEPADDSTAEEFAASLPDHPFTFGARSLLQRGVGKAWVRGSASHPTAAVVAAPWLASEPMAFGSDPEEIWTILCRIPGWECVHLATGVAPRLAAVVERELRTPTRLYEDVYYVLDRPPVRQDHPSVRRLTEGDLGMVERASAPLRPNGFLSTLAALTGGVAAGGVVEGELVSCFSMSVSSESYADVGGHTLEPWRNRGLGSAAGFLVAREVQSRGLTPVWRTGEDNFRSQHVAEKLGFREYGRQTYVIVPIFQKPPGYRVESAGDSE
jgi:hypothetical protein